MGGGSHGSGNYSMIGGIIIRGWRVDGCIEGTTLLKSIRVVILWIVLIP